MELTTKQATQINERIWPTLGYLYRMRERMIKLRVPHDDPLYVKVEDAYCAMHKLCIDLHYQSCESGVWRGR